MGKLSSSVLEMRHGRARGRVSASKALGLRCGSRSQVRAMIPCLLLGVRVRVNIYICGWMSIYCPARRFPFAWNCRRVVFFFSPLYLPLPLPLSLLPYHYRDCCVCVNSFSFLWFSKAQHNTTQPWQQHPTSKKGLKHTVHLHPISVRPRVTMERSSDVAAPLSSMEKCL